MRYYEFTITDPSGEVWYPATNGLGFSKENASWGASFSSLYTPWVCNSAASPLLGKTNPSALNIEFDLPIAPQHTLQGAATARVWGLGVRALAQASNLNPVDGVSKTWTLRAGMAAGLPLANPSQSGVLAGGTVYQAFGNWEDVNQTLDLILYPGPTPILTAGITWIWKKGTTLSSALALMFSQAFPAYKQDINISSNLIAPSDQMGCYLGLPAFAKYLLAYTKPLGAQTMTGYQGVAVVVKNNTIMATDGAGADQPSLVQLNFQDLVGQPTWIAANTITFATVMRGDIDYGDYVRFPTGVMTPYALTQADAAFPNSPAASSTAFQGSFRITDIHHYANFRESDASSWSTMFQAVLQPKPAITSSVLSAFGS